MRILHLTTAPVLEAARRTGWYRTSTLGLTLEQQGFVHASSRAQLPRVAETFYADVEEPLVVLVLDVAVLTAAGSPVVWEVPEGLDEAYPHVYGPVPMAAVVAELPASFRGRRFVPPDTRGMDVA